MNEKDFEKIESMISRQIGVFADSVNHKFDILVEGHQMLSDKLDRVENRLDQRIGCVERKLDTVAAETSNNTKAIKTLSAETKNNTKAIKTLSAETKNNTEAIKTLSAETKNNTEAIKTLSGKIDAVATDLREHRADSEVHKKVYKIKED